MSQHFSKLIELAQTLKWQVWAYDVPDFRQVEPGTNKEIAKLIAPRKRIYVLRSPNGVPFRDGKPVVAEQLSEEESADITAATYRFTFKAPARETELEAWQDLPEGEHDAFWKATDAERAAAVEAFRADLQPMVALHLVTIDAQERVALTHMGFGHGYAVSLWTQGVSPKLAKQWGWKGVPIPDHPMKFLRPTEAEKRMVWDIHDPGKADEVNAWWNEETDSV